MREYFKVFDTTTGMVDFMSSIAIAKMAKVSEDVVREYVDVDKKLRNKWMICSLGINKSVAEADNQTSFEKAFAKEWDEAVKPFRRVKWVKQGGLKLYVEHKESENEEV